MLFAKYAGRFKKTIKIFLIVIIVAGWISSGFPVFKDKEGKDYGLMEVKKAMAMTTNRAMIVYALGTNTTPRYRLWDGSQWGSESSATAVTNTIQYIDVRFSRTRDEAIMITLDASGDLLTQNWNGSGWSTTTRHTNVGTTNDIYKGFDIEYEKNGDRAVLVFNDNNNSNPVYRTWSGSSWSSTSSISIPTSGAPVWIDIAQKPTATSNEIALITLDANNDVCGRLWNGSSWGNMGDTSTWDTSASSATSSAAAVAYEQQTGEIMFAWADQVSTDNYYRTWNGTTLASSTLLDIPAMGGVGRWVKMASDPFSDKIMFGVQDNGLDLNTRQWSGSAWDAAAQHAEHTANAEDNLDRNFDITYETHPLNQGKAWLVFGNGATVSWKSWTGSWGTASTNGDDTAYTTLFAHPSSGEVFAAIYEDSTSATDDILGYNLVNGTSTWSSATTIWGGATVGNPVAQRVAINAPPTEYEQSAYRWFNNNNGTDVGSALAAQNTTSSLVNTGDQFRLRMLVHVGRTDLALNSGQFKLQFAGKGTSTSCASPNGTPSVYTDITTSTAISYYDNGSVSDGATTTANANDPSHLGHATTVQSYEELNNFSNSKLKINAGRDGLWDFALYDNGAPVQTTFCLRALKSNEELFVTYSQYPEITTARPVITQNYFRFYADNNTTTPSDPWPPGGSDLGENAGIGSSNAPPSTGANFRLRMTLQVNNAEVGTTTKSFKLKYGERITSCSAISSWFDLGTPTSSSIWRGYDAAPADGVALSDNPPLGGQLKIVSVSDRGATYEEQNNTALNPYRIAPTEDVEFDWNIQNNGATASTTYCFKMVNSDDSNLDGYNYYPSSVTPDFEPRSQNWQWFDDEYNITPTSSLAGEGVAPSAVELNNLIKLRLTIKDTINATGTDRKFRLQFSEYSDFSKDVQNLVEIGSCQSDSLWCYANGAGNDNDIISGRVLSDSFYNGTHNESGVSTTTFDAPANIASEYEFTIKHAAARANAVYFFRAFDISANKPIPLNTGENYPSLTTEGTKLFFTINGLPSATTTEGVTTDATTTATAVGFGTVAFGTEIEAAQRLNVTTNATEGYQVFVYERQEFLGPSGSKINRIDSTNEIPSAWNTACSATSTSCYGYHAGDDILSGGSTRFSVNNTYAAFATSSKEIAFSSVPVENEQTDIIYKLKVNEEQKAGAYQTSVVYIAVPSF